VLLALDRQERGSESGLSAVQEVREQFGIPVIAVVASTISCSIYRGSAVPRSWLTCKRTGNVTELRTRSLSEYFA